MNGGGISHKQGKESTSLSALNGGSRLDMKNARTQAEYEDPCRISRRTPQNHAGAILKEKLSVCMAETN